MLHTIYCCANSWGAYTDAICDLALDGNVDAIAKIVKMIDAAAASACAGQYDDEY